MWRRSQEVREGSKLRHRWELKKNRRDVEKLQSLNKIHRITQKYRDYFAQPHKSAGKCTWVLQRGRHCVKLLIHFYHRIHKIIKSATNSSCGWLRPWSFWCLPPSSSSSCLFSSAARWLDWTTSFRGPCKKFTCISASPWIPSTCLMASFSEAFSTSSSSFCSAP